MDLSEWFLCLCLPLLVLFLCRCFCFFSGFRAFFFCRSFRTPSFGVLHLGFGSPFVSGYVVITLESKRGVFC